MSKTRIGALLLLTFSLFYGYLSLQIRVLPFQANAAFTAQTMPTVLTFLAVILSTVLLVFPGEKDRPNFSGYNLTGGVIFLALMSAYGFTIRPFGFMISTILFLIAGFTLLGERSILKMILIAVPLVISFWVLMTQGLDVYIDPLPGLLR